MAKIYKRSDRINVRIGEVEVSIAPLTLEQKTEAQVLMAKGQINRDYAYLQKGVVYMLKRSVKKIKGLVTSDGKPYELSFDENDALTDECVDDLFNVEMHKKLVMVCSSLVGVIPDEFTDNQGNKLEGVEIVPNKSEEPQNPN